MIAPLLLVLCSTVVQTDTLQSFRTPASPAFILLGTAPTAVERPSTPQSLVVSLISTLEDDHFPPKRYALEFAPYWLTRHRTLTFDQYAAPGFWQSIVQTLSISVATVRLPKPDTGTVLAFGLRTAYVSSRDLSAIKPLRDSLEHVQEKILLTENAVEVTRLKAQAKGIALRLQHALRTERLGWTIEGAAAGSLAFPGDVAQNGKLSRAAIWVTSGYRVAKPRCDLLTVVRLTRDERTAPRQNLFDLGGRLVVDKEDFQLSAEYVFRSVTAGGTSRSTYRLTAGAEYRLRNDLYVTATLGRGPLDESGGAPLIAQVGVDFGLGPVPLLSLGKTQ